MSEEKLNTLKSSLEKVYVQRGKELMLG